MEILIPPRSVKADRIYKIVATYSMGEGGSDSSTEYSYGSKERARDRQREMIQELIHGRELPGLTAAQITSEIIEITGIGITIT